MQRALCTPLLIYKQIDQIKPEFISGIFLILCTFLLTCIWLHLSKIIYFNTQLFSSASLLVNRPTPKISALFQQPHTFVSLLACEPKAADNSFNGIKKGIRRSSHGSQHSQQIQHRECQGRQQTGWDCLPFPAIIKLTFHHLHRSKQPLGPGDLGTWMEGQDGVLDLCSGGPELKTQLTPHFR